MNPQRLSSLFLLLGTAVGQSLSPVPRPGPRADGTVGPLGDELARRAPQAFERVLHDDPGTGVLWSVGADWKASFGSDGFTFIPFFGATAPKNFPVRFRIAAVQVDGRDVPFAADSKPTRVGDRVTFDRGAVREIYDLSLRQVEQTFVVDTTLAGDVTVELAVDSELSEDATRPGLQFGNRLGQVHYGEAFAVLGQDKAAIESTWNGRSIRLHVPAHLRGPGPVVIDPILSTMGANYLGPVPNTNPDVAYDGTNNVYLVAWESVWSAIDTDVHCELFDGGGAPIPASGALLDSSGAQYTGPRVAGLNVANRFLVVMQRADANQPQVGKQVYGRVRDAGGNQTVFPEVRLSDANDIGDHTYPEIGGDRDTGAGPHRWLVVWTHVRTSLEYRLTGQLVLADGQPDVAGPILLTVGAPRMVFAPQVSRCMTDPDASRNRFWYVVYSREVTATDRDVEGVSVDARGTVSGSLPLSVGSADDLYPQVSSPATDVTGTKAWFLVTFARQNPASTRAVVHDATTHTVSSSIDLTSLGFGPYWARAESDGIRFAVTASLGASADRIGVGTLAFDGTFLRVHEAPQLIPGSTSHPRIVATHSGSGTPSNYAVCTIEHTPALSRPQLSTYRGHATGVEILRRAMACNGLALQVSGRPLLGFRVQFTLANLGGAVPGFAVGFPSPSPIPLCSTCALGLQPDLPIFTTFGATTLALTIPGDVALVGSTLAVQGIAVGQGPCLAGLSLSDTVDLTIR